MKVKLSTTGGLPQRVPDFVQATPRHVSMAFLAAKAPGSTVNSTKHILALAPENSRLHAIIERGGADFAGGVSSPEEQEQLCHLEYHVCTLSGKTVSCRRLPVFNRPSDDKKTQSFSNISLTSPAEVCAHSV